MSPAVTIGIPSCYDIGGHVYDSICSSVVEIQNMMAGRGWTTYEPDSTLPEQAFDHFSGLSRHRHCAYPQQPRTKLQKPALAGMTVC